MSLLGNRVDEDVHLGKGLGSKNPVSMEMLYRIPI